MNKPVVLTQFDVEFEGWFVRCLVDDPPPPPANGELDVHELFDPTRHPQLATDEIHESMISAIEYESSVAAGDLTRESLLPYDAGPSLPEIDASALVDELYETGGEPPGLVESETVSNREAALGDELSDWPTRQMPESFVQPTPTQFESEASLDQIVDGEFSQLGGPDAMANPGDLMPPSFGPMGW